MAVRDIRSNLQPSAGNIAAVTGNGTTNGVSIDTSHFELGLMFAISVGNYTDGTYNVTLEESDTGAFGGEETAITDSADANRLIGTLAGMAVSAAQSNGDVLPTVGLISNKQFVRMNVVATSVTTGADVLITVTQKGEEMPVV